MDEQAEHWTHSYTTRALYVGEVWVHILTLVSHGKPLQTLGYAHFTQRMLHRVSHITTPWRALPAGEKINIKIKVLFFNICLCLVLSFVFVISASPRSCGNRTGTPPTWSVSGHLIRHKVVFPSLRSQQIIRSVPQLFSAGVQILSAHPFRVTNECRPGQPPHRLSDWCPLRNRKSWVFHPSFPWRLPRQRGFRWRGVLTFSMMLPSPDLSASVCLSQSVCTWVTLCVCVWNDPLVSVRQQTGSS